MYNFLLCPINEISRKWLNLYMCLWFLCQMFFVLDTAKFLTCSEKWFKWICKKYWGSTSVRRSLSLSILSFYNKPDFPKKKKIVILFCSGFYSCSGISFEIYTCSVRHNSLRLPVCFTSWIYWIAIKISSRV